MSGNRLSSDGAYIRLIKHAYALRSCWTWRGFVLLPSTANYKRPRDCEAAYSYGRPAGPTRDAACGAPHIDKLGSLRNEAPADSDGQSAVPHPERSSLRALLWPFDLWTLVGMSARLGRGTLWMHAPQSVQESKWALVPLLTHVGNLSTYDAVRANSWFVLLHNAPPLQEAPAPDQAMFFV